MFQQLLELDKDVFLFLNGFHSPVWDTIMWYITRTATWLPLYILILIALIRNDQSYRIIFTFIFLAIVVLLNDQISVLIKHLVERPRPTHNPAIADLVHTVNNYRGGQYGFLSSHAANVFGVAVFLIYLLKNSKWTIVLLLWALVVSYSRIYLGKHYPLDIICGAILGILIGTQCHVIRVKTVIAADRRIDIRKEKKAAKRKARELKAKNDAGVENTVSN